MRYTGIQNAEPKHSEWLKSLDFYKEDLDILINRLNEVAGKNNSKEAEIAIEHFENQFDIQRQNISDLQHRVKSNLHSCANDVQQHAGKVNELVAHDIKEIEQDMTDFEKAIKEFRKEFSLFLSKWM